MWTPKRFLIYILGLVGFMAAFGVVYFTVPVDGLPPLPPHLAPDDSGESNGFIPLDQIISQSDLKIKYAFGNDCEESSRLSKVWLPSKGAVLTINNFEIQKDGRVKLSPFSIGLFAKSKGGERFPEINTIQCEYAMLTLDRPATSLTELGSRKVVGVELGGDGGVKLTNNRKSQEKSDDLEMYVTEGKLFYEDARNLIWSNGYVKILDTQSKPAPTVITAVGLEVVLNKDISPNRNKKAEPAKKADGKTAGVNGVEMIRLLANVDMHLHTDARSGFMAGPDELAKKPAAKGTPEEKAHVHIKTNGKFVFDLVKDTARFDAPEQAALAHDRVTVTRHLAAKAPKIGMVTDSLECDRLDLQFRKKIPIASTVAPTVASTAAPSATTAPAKSATDGSGDKDIEFAIATAKPDAIVELHLEGEEMHAFGVEMRYFAATGMSGPRTILKGSPMHAIRQGHQIRAEELHLKGADKQGNGQEAFAKGPGKIDLLDKKLGRSTTHILFKNSFTATKDKDGDRTYDLITIRGDASVIDEEHKQEMHAAQFLHVWLEEIKRDPAPAVAATLTSSSAPIGEPRLPDVITPPITIGAPKKDEPKSDLAAASQKNRLHKIEAFEKVQVRSPELNIRDANHLTICFREQKIIVQPKTFEGVQALPAIGPATGEGPKGETEKKPGEPGLPVAGAPKDEKEKEKVRRPLEITASEITAYVATMGNTKELLEFVAEGNVHVSQTAENPKDKGLDIVGNMLSLVRKTGGDILYVFGEPRKLAQLQHNEVLLFGPKVTIDQVENIANVEGTGAMHMPSNTSLDGKKQEGHLTIHWNKSMWFNGRSADFDGGVEAFQGNGKIRCQQMQVTFDKPVNFKQTKGSQSSKVDKILCNGQGDQRVYILEEDRDKSNKIVTYRRLLLAVVEVDNLEQRLNGSGPGVLDFIGQASASDPGLGPKDGPKETPKDAAKKDEDKILKWTRVRFEGQMISYPTAGGGRQTTFLDQVRVYHQPGEDPNVRDPQAVGPGGLFFTCQRLTLVQRKVGGKNSQEMHADGMNGMVNFQAQDFHGNAKTVKYDENQEQIIFEGVPGAPATLYKRPNIQGAQPQRLQGTKILYNRKTGEFLLDGVRVISSWLMPDEPRTYEVAALDRWVVLPEGLQRAW